MPMSEINDLWCGVMNKFDHILHVQQFFDYLKDTWMDEACFFPTALWNYYNFDGPRTASRLKGWYHTLNSNIGTTSPNLYAVIEESRKDYAFNMAALKQLENNTNIYYSESTYYGINDSLWKRCFIIRRVFGQDV